jgi:radical SAM superfamily enzyme YgiQ (UPF0313 family)
MKIALMDVQTRKTAINKTIAGGYGTSSKYSDSKDLRILFLQKFKKKGVYVPLIDLAYHAAIFKRRGYEVEVVYGNTIPEADIYIIYGSLVEHDSEISTAIEIRKKFKEVKIGFIGLLTTVLPDLFLKSSDFIVTGESEKFFLQTNKPVESLKGVINAGMIEKDLDSLPFPDWSFFNMKKFVHYPFFDLKSVFPVLTSRGCPFSCGYYCPYPIRGGKIVRYRSIEIVINELNYLKEKFNSEAIFFCDPIFTLNRKRTVKLCEEIIKSKIKLSWACETHPICLDKELIDLMYKAGARAMIIGVESRTPEVIKQMKRKDTDEKLLKDIVSYCETKGIALSANYILGNLSDTEETINNTINYAINLNTSYAQFVISTPYPGTQYYKSLKNTLTTKNLSNYDAYTLVFKHPNLTNEQLERLKAKAFIKYYFRLEWILNKFLRKKLNGLLKTYREFLLFA